MDAGGDDRDDAERLVEAGVRPTERRLAIMGVIRDGGRRHLTPESFHSELAAAGIGMSLATVYNTLNSFSDAGLLRRVGFGERTFFCTNPAEHHHFYDELTGRIQDIPGPQPQVVGLPPPPSGSVVLGVEVIVRIRRI